MLLEMILISIFGYFEGKIIIQDNETSEVSDLWQICSAIPIIVLGFIRHDEVTFLADLPDLLALAFVLIIAFLFFKESLGEADVIQMGILGMFLYLYSSSVITIPISWLLAFVLHGIRYRKFMKKGKLTEPKPFVEQLVYGTALTCVLLWLKEIIVMLLSRI